MSALYLVVLDCKHQLHFQAPPPKVNDILWCNNCRKERRVESAPEEWRIRCVKCTYARTFGVSRTDAELAAGKHLRKMPEHKVKLFNGNRLINTFGQKMQAIF